WDKISFIFSQMPLVGIILLFLSTVNMGCFSSQQYLQLQKQNEVQARIIHQAEEKIRALEKEVKELRKKVDQNKAQ
ncbi:MAG: hypothetical protein D6785_11510, partial [Planctomycetota bacterium]